MIRLQAGDPVFPTREWRNYYFYKSIKKCRLKAACTATIFHISDVETAIEYYTGVPGFCLEFRCKDLAGLNMILFYLPAGLGQHTKKAVGEVNWIKSIILS